jgi:hypothetical protein
VLLHSFKRLYAAAFCCLSSAAVLETGNYEQAAHANGKEGTMTAVEYQTEFSMWAISASPLTVTTPVMNCTADSAPTPAPPSGCGVALVKKLSNHGCTKDEDYGCIDSNSMFISQGCRGDFTCGGKNVTANCDNGVCKQDKNCYSCDGQVIKCPDSPFPKITCKGWISDLQKKILLNKVGQRLYCISIRLLMRLLTSVCPFCAWFIQHPTGDD